MKRFLLFTGDKYYAKGGWRDFSGSYDNEEAAFLAACRSAEYWYQIVDSSTGKTTRWYGTPYSYQDPDENDEQTLYPRPQDAD